MIDAHIVVPAMTSVQGGSPVPKERLELDMPAVDGMLDVVRLAMGAIASKAAFDVDDVEDLQLAADELCASVVRCLGGALARLRIVTTWDDGYLEARCTGGSWSDGSDDDIGDFEVDKTAMVLSRLILDTLVDEHGSADDGRVAWFVKRGPGS